MRKNVCMFVWNHFTNDARVLRECTALSENGYAVDLICIHDPNNPDLKQYEEVNEHFHVHRVKRYPSSLLFMKKAYRALLTYKVLALIAFLLWLGAAYVVPYVVLPVTIVAALLLKTKLQVVWVRGSIILRMILKRFLKDLSVQSFALSVSTLCMILMRYKRAEQVMTAAYTQKWKLSLLIRLTL